MIFHTIVLMFVDLIRDVSKRIVDAEMDLTLAKSRGYLRQNNSTASGKRLLAVIGVYTGFGSHLNRKAFRGSWMPKGIFLLIIYIYKDLMIYLKELAVYIFFS